MIGIDLCEFSSEHKGGKDEVAYNLLSGLKELGYVDKFICFCHEELVGLVKAIDNNIRIIVVPKFLDSKGIVRRYKKGKYVNDAISNNGIRAILYTTKRTPPIKMRCKSVVIPHDIQVFECKKIPGIELLLKYKIIEKINIILDFYFRDRIVAISDYDKEQIIHYLPWTRKKVVRIYNPIKFMESESEGSKRYITALNVQWKHKNVETLVKAYIKIKDKVKFDLNLVGKYPPNYESLIDLCRLNNVEERVRFTGFVSRRELQKIISETRLYVNTSFYEGFGMTAVEMMGRGIPTIVAENTAQKEVTLGLCGYYSPADDENILAEVILKELNNPINKEELEEVATQIRKSYSYINIAREYWNMLCSLAEYER